MSAGTNSLSFGSEHLETFALALSHGGRAMERVSDEVQPWKRVA